jgi:hypothetical protein
MRGTNRSTRHALSRGYTHRNSVLVDETMVVFEPDEEGGYRTLEPKTLLQYLWNCYRPWLKSLFSYCKDSFSFQNKKPYIIVLGDIAGYIIIDSFCLLDKLFR